MIPAGSTWLLWVTGGKIRTKRWSSMELGVSTSLSKPTFTDRESTFHAMPSKTKPKRKVLPRWQSVQDTKSSVCPITSSGIKIPPRKTATLGMQLLFFSLLPIATRERACISQELADTFHKVLTIIGLKFRTNNETHTVPRTGLIRALVLVFSLGDDFRAAFKTSSLPSPFPPYPGKHCSSGPPSSGIWRSGEGFANLGASNNA